MGDDDFLSRWSRRKRSGETETEFEPRAREPEIELREPETEEEEAQLLAELNLPVPESLREGDDFSAFMAKGVPAFLRKRALRVLWRSNPVLANLDGLNDYDEDFTSPELTQKVLATGYQVGRGFVSQVIDRDEPSASDPADQQPGEEAASPPAGPEHSEDTGDFSAEVADSPDVEVAESQIRPRRMRFES